jgi:hypothetical protein
MTPLPVADSFDALNARFLHACTRRGEAILRGHTNSIAERMRADVTAFMQLPPAPYDACHKIATRVSCCHWCVTGTTITRCQRVTVIRRF